MKHITCPKCQAESGDAWSQCGRSRPMPMSPHFVEGHPQAAEALRRLQDMHENRS